MVIAIVASSTGDTGQGKAGVGSTGFARLAFIAQSRGECKEKVCGCANCLSCQLTGSHSIISTLEVRKGPLPSPDANPQL